MAQRDQRLATDRPTQRDAQRDAHRPTRTARERREPLRALRRLRGSQRFLPLLILVAVVSTFGLAAITYVAARVSATSQAETEALHDAQVTRQFIADQGPGLTVSGGNLVVGADTAVYTLNGETTLIDRTRNLTGDYATIYQLEGSQLNAVASNLPTSGSAPELGDSLSGAAYAALVGNCGAVDEQTCHHPYSGLVTLHGTDYVVGMQPLFDASGAFVGALGAAQPLSAVLAPVNQFAVVLVLVGLLLSFICIFGGNWLIGSRSEHMLATIDARLDGVAEAAAELERLAQTQIVRANARGRAARELNEHTRALDGLAAAMEEGQASLRESAGGIWNEMSQPGVTPEPQTATRWAREAAVTSSRVGTAAARARDVCRQLVTLMNHIVAENGVAADAGREMQFHARELRRSVEGVESALGERLITRPHGIAASPLVRRMRRWLPTHAPERADEPRKLSRDSAGGQTGNGQTGNGQTGQRTSGSRGRAAAEPLVSDSLWIGKGSHPQTGEHRAAHLNDASSQQPRMRPSSDPGRPGATGEYPRMPQARANQSGQWDLSASFGATQRVDQQPRHPSTPSAWAGTGEYPALPRSVRPPSNPTSRDGQPHGSIHSLGSSQWRPSSGLRNPDQVAGAGFLPPSGVPDNSQVWPTFDLGLPAFDSNEHPRIDGPSRGPRWPQD